MLTLTSLLTLAGTAAAHYVLDHSSGQLTLGDDEIHPEWADRQKALGHWTGPDSYDSGDTVVTQVGSGVGGCGGVCVLTPESMEGPFFLDYNLHRSNITESQPGVPLELTLAMFQISSSLSTRAEHSVCEPLAGAWVDVWSCDSEGVYSGYAKNNNTGPPGGPGRHPPGDGNEPPRGPGGPGGPGGRPMHAEPTTNTTFLRGVGKTDSEGLVTFQTVYPGWYTGRTTHIHIKVHPPSWSDPSTHNETHAHTTQLFFPDSANDYISTLSPYRENIVRRMSNEEDGQYRQMAGTSVVKLTYHGDVGPGFDLPWTGIYSDGYIQAELAVGVDKWW